MELVLRMRAPSRAPCENSFQAQIASLNVEDTVAVSSEYSNYVYVFSSNYAAELPKHTALNDPGRGPASDLIKPFKSLSGAPILFVQIGGRNSPTFEPSSTPSKTIERNNWARFLPKAELACL